MSGDETQGSGVDIRGLNNARSGEKMNQDCYFWIQLALMKEYLRINNTFVTSRLPSARHMAKIWKPAASGDGGVPKR